jgi:hypothetical protein
LFSEKSIKIKIIIKIELLQTIFDEMDQNQLEIEDHPDFMSLNRKRFVIYFTRF